MKPKRIATAALVALLGLSLVACGPKVTTPAPPKTPLQKAVIAEADISDAIGQLQTALIAGNQQGAIPDAVVSKVFAITLKAAIADQQATNITKSVSALTPDQQKSIAALFVPISAAIADSLASGFLPITNPNTAVSIRALLVSLQGILSSLQIAMGS